jgi:hypothetical protein
LAVIRSNAANQVVQVVRGQYEALIAPPAGATQSLVVDDDTNADLLAEISADLSPWTLTGTLLQKSGVTRTPAADGPGALVRTSSFGGAVRLSQDRSTTSTSYQDVVGLAFPLAANCHYAFQFEGAYTTAVNTTGIQLALNGPAFSVLAAGFQLFTSATAVLAALAANYDVGVNGTASAAGTALPFRIYGNISTTAAGLLIVRGRSEVNGSAVTVRAGSYGLLFKVG